MEDFIKEKTKYYKSFNDKLQGKNNFQFEVNGIYKIDHSDNWEWFHYSQYASPTIKFQDSETRIRMCIVEPLGRIYKYKYRSNFYNKGYYYTTNIIRICNELSVNEILDVLTNEKCNFLYLLRKIKPPFDFLLTNKKKIRGNSISSLIAKRRDLSDEEKYELLPKSQYKRVMRIQWY